MVAYRLLTGVVPFPGPSLHELSHQILYTTPPPPSQEEVIEQLQKLGELKAQGILTEQEFAAQKARILGG